MAIKPYQVLNLDLSTANTAGYSVYGEFGLIRVLNARTSSGGIASHVVIELQPEDLPRFDMSLGQAALMAGVRRWSLYWAAQAGVTVQIGMSADPGQIDWDMDPPTQLVVTGTDPLLVAVNAGDDVDTVNARTFAGAYQETAEAAKYAHVALWNPSDSGVKVYLTGLLVGPPEAGNIYLQQLTATLAGVAAGSNKTFGEAGSAADIVTGRYAAIQGTAFSSGGFYASSQGDFPPLPMLTRNPIVLNPGHGLAVAFGTVNKTISAIFEWAERAA